jgi:hypothetical protein
MSGGIHAGGASPPIVSQKAKAPRCQQLQLHSLGGCVVSITPFLRNKPFDPDTVSLMSRTLERVCAELGLKLEDPAAEVVAFKVIELVQRGVRTQTGLYLLTMAAFKLGEERKN